MYKNIVEAIFQDQQDELTMFLKTLFNQANGYIEIRKIGESRSEQHFFPITHAGFSLIQNYINQTDKIDIYFGVHPRKNEKGNSEAIETCYTLFADFDPEPTEINAHDYKTNEETRDGALMYHYQKTANGSASHDLHCHSSSLSSKKSNSCRPSSLTAAEATTCIGSCHKKSPQRNGNYFKLNCSNTLSTTSNCHQQSKSMKNSKTYQELCAYQNPSTAKPTARPKSFH